VPNIRNHATRKSVLQKGFKSQWQSVRCSNRVRTDPGKLWKVLEFDVEIFQALKSLENDHRYGKVWKNP